MQKTKTGLSSKARQAAKRPVDVYFEKYAEYHKNSTNKLIHCICILLVVFSLFGLVWAIPFPHLEFLGRYNGFVNWASFLIGFSIYYYYRLSPVLSYAMLLLVMIFSAGIVGLEKLHNLNGWPPMWQICLAIFVPALLGQIVGQKIEGKKSSFLNDVQLLLIGPIWLLHFLFKKAGIKY